MLDVLIEDAISRDRTTARRAAFLEILCQEHYLTREQLIVRVEGKSGKGCFGDTEFWVSRKGLTSLWGDLLARIQAQK